MALFRGKQEYIALDANNITLVFDSGNIVNISGNIFLYPPQGHPILYNYLGRRGTLAVIVSSDSIQSITSHFTYDICFLSLRIPSSLNNASVPRKVARPREDVRIGIRPQLIFNIFIIVFWPHFLETS